MTKDLYSCVSRLAYWRVWSVLSFYTYYHLLWPVTYSCFTNPSIRNRNKGWNEPFACPCAVTLPHWRWKRAVCVCVCVCVCVLSGVSVSTVPASVTRCIFPSVLPSPDDVCVCLCFVSSQEDAQRHEDLRLRAVRKALPGQPPAPDAFALPLG